MIRTLLVGCALGVAIAVPVGPVAALTLERTLTRGLRFGLATALGAGLADALFGAVAAFGVGFITDWVRAHEVSLRVVGVVVLAYLAVEAWRRRDRLAQPPAEPAPGALVRSLASGFALTASSPLTLVTFAVALASVGVIEGPRAAVPLGVLVGSGGWYAALAALMSLLRSRLQSKLAMVGAASSLFLAACAVLSAALAVHAALR